jgi:hypothetical protein
MLGRLAAGAPRLALWATGLIGAVGAVTSFALGMRRANEVIKERISELAQYSSALALGQAREQIAQLNRDLQEIHENGQMYAAAQRLDTVAANEWAKTMVTINKVLAGIGMGWSLLKIGASAAIRAQMFQLTFPQQALNFLIGQFDQFFKRQFNTPLTEVVTKALRGGTMFGLGGVAGLLFGRSVMDKMPGWLDAVLKNLEIIKTNTGSKDLAGEVNDWFRADVMAMTGRPY